MIRKEHGRLQEISLMYYVTAMYQLHEKLHRCSVNSTYYFHDYNLKVEMMIHEYTWKQ